MDKKLEVTLIIPTMNECEGMKAIMPRIKKEWYDELIIVDGGSTDGTIEYCKENGYPVITQSGKGLPQAFVDAFEHSTKDIIITLSPDGNSIPELIPTLVEKIHEGYDIVIASRYLGSAKSHDDDIFTRFGNRMFTKMVNLLFGAKYTDTLVIFRAYRREALLMMRLHKHEKENWLRKVFFYMNGWELGSSIRAAKLKLKVCEISGDEPERIGGSRKLSIVKNGLGALLQVLYEWIIGGNFLKKQ